MFDTRKNKHEANVRLIKKNIKEEKIKSAETRVGKEDGFIARHTTPCSQGIDWNESKVVVTERNSKQKKLEKA